MGNALETEEKEKYIEKESLCINKIDELLLSGYLRDIIESLDKQNLDCSIFFNIIACYYINNFGWGCYDYSFKNNKMLFLERPRGYGIFIMDEKKVDNYVPIVSEKRETAKKFANKSRRAQEIAQMLGITSDINSSIRDIDISCFKYVGRFLGMLILGGSRRRSLNTLRRYNNISLHNKDRVAAVSFQEGSGWKNVLKGSSLRWKNCCENKLCNLNDLYNDKLKMEKAKIDVNQYPKLGLKIIAKMRYVCDLDKDKQPNREYIISSKKMDHKYLLQVLTENSKKIVYILN